MIWFLLNGFVGTGDKLVAGIRQEQGIICRWRFKKQEQEESCDTFPYALIKCRVNKLFLIENNVGQAL
jgi:hypothetical protein